jgi:hypothetical protein
VKCRRSCSLTSGSPTASRSRMKAFVASLGDHGPPSGRLEKTESPSQADAQPACSLARLQFWLQFMRVQCCPSEAACDRDVRRWMTVNKGGLKIPSF